MQFNVTLPESIKRKLIQEERRGWNIDCDVYSHYNDQYWFTSEFSGRSYNVSYPYGISIEIIHKFNKIGTIKQLYLGKTITVWVYHSRFNWNREYKKYEIEGKGVK